MPKLRSAFFQRHATGILLVMIFMMPFAFLGARRALLTNHNEVQQWLPAEYEETTTFQWFRKYFADEDFILASWEGCNLEDQRLRMLCEKLVPPPTENQDAIASKDAPGPLFKELITGPQLLDRLTNPPISLPREKAINRLKGTLIGPDGNTTCVVLTLSEDGKKNLRGTVQTVIRTATEECGIPRKSLHMGGPPIDNVSIDSAGEESLLRLAGLAAVIGLAISWACLRSGRLIAMVFTAGIYSAAVGLAIVWFTGNTMNAILMTMPSLVYVAAISGAIHLSNYYRDTSREHGAQGAPGRALLHASLPLSLATGTTAVGLLSLCYSELVPIKMFGLFSALGVCASMFVLCLFLPSMFQAWPLPVLPTRRIEDEDGEVVIHRPSRISRRFSILGRQIVRHNGKIAIGCIIVLAICGYGMTQMKSSVHLMRLFNSEAPILGDYKWLETHLGELVPMEIVLKVDNSKCHLTFLEKMELVARVQRQVEKIEEVGGTLSGVTMAPELPKAEDYRNGGGVGGALAKIAVRNKYTTVRRVFNDRMESHRDEYIQGKYLAEEGDVELWRISARVGALNDVDYGLFVSEIKDVVEPVLEKYNDKGIQGIEAVYTGLVPLIYKAQRSLLDGLQFGFVLDLVLITIVMMIAVRDWSAGLLLVLPAVFPAVIIFGLMGWTGRIVDIGTVMAPSVALGVTVDDVVHFMLQFRSALAKGKTRRQAVTCAYQHCARAMYQSWGVIGLGLSVFALSPFTPTQRFGYMMVTLLTASLVGNLLLLPSLLAGPLGSLFGRSLRRKALALKQQDAAQNGGPTSALRIHTPQPTTAAGSRRQRIQA